MSSTPLNEVFEEVLKLIESHELNNAQVMSLAQELQNYALIGLIETIVASATAGVGAEKSKSP